MGAVGGILMVACVVAVLFGPDEGNAMPWLIAGIIGTLMIIAAAIDA